MFFLQVHYFQYPKYTITNYIQGDNVSCSVVGDVASFHIQNVFQNVVAKIDYDCHPRHQYKIVNNTARVLGAIKEHA